MMMRKLRCCSDILDRYREKIRKKGICCGEVRDGYDR